jgi:uncharacterized RDD family membrane protein YckC/Tfp pilus assembly protein PilE
MIRENLSGKHGGRGAMFCPKCGKQNLASGRLCSNCGAQLPLSPGAAPAAAVAGVYAGFWKRFAAFVLDYIIILVLAMMAGAVIGLIYGVGAGAPTDDAASGLSAIAGLLVWWLYYALMESSSTQATLGKMALGIRVVDRGGNAVSFGRATGRNFAKFLSGMILMIGYLMAGFTSRKQALHDIMAGCLVVNRGASAEQMQQGVSATGMPAWAIVVVILAAMVLPVGILAAIALPAYQDFTVRARMATAVLVGQQATQAVEAFYARNNTLPRDLKEAGMADPASRDVRQVNVSPGNGTVQVMLAMSPLEGKSVLFVPQRDESNRVIWTCRSDDVPPRYLPPNCRQKQN